jgi:phosphotransferase system HPr (HPr) family protein
MKLIRVRIPWEKGLHLRPASQLVRLAKASKSVICLRVGEKVADARSILAILLLCAVAGRVVDVEITGEDEDAVLTSVTSVFNQSAPGENFTHGDSAT